MRLAPARLAGSSKGRTFLEGRSSPRSELSSIFKIIFFKLKHAGREGKARKLAAFQEQKLTALYICLQTSPACDPSPLARQQRKPLLHHPKSVLLPGNPQQALSLNPLHPDLHQILLLQLSEVLWDHAAEPTQSVLVLRQPRGLQPSREVYAWCLGRWSRLCHDRISKYWRRVLLATST